MLERDIESVLMDYRQNICIGRVTPEDTIHYRERAKHLGFQDVRAGFAIKRPKEEEDGKLQVTEPRYSDKKESMIFTAE